MTRTHTPVERQFGQNLTNTANQLAAANRSQQLVITDPPSTTDPSLGKGDPTPGHSYATVVIGNLLPISGIEAIGLAVYSGGPDGTWTQVLS